MSRIERRFEAPRLDPDGLEQRLEGLGWKAEQREGRVEARQGSQLMTRLLGGWQVNPRKLPKRLVADRAGAGMTVTLEETLGLGYLDPKLRRKYEETFADLEREIAG